MSSLFLDLDEAWPREALPDVEYLDARDWGPRLRFSARRQDMEAFSALIGPRDACFTLFGSGDYHHLSALWLRRVPEPVTLVSFDNHPDWDIRPPYWCCGTWVNRALALPHVRRAVIWGCGNFELHWPNNLFANHRALRSRRIVVRPWAERLKLSARGRWPGVTRDDWRQKFSDFAKELRGEACYVTVDLDALRMEEAATNWENGLFTAEDVGWALRQLGTECRIIAGDVCGAYSVPKYARWKQRIESSLDHPELPPIKLADARQRNLSSLRSIWPHLVSPRLNAAGG